MFLPGKVGRKEKDFVLYCVKNHCKGGNVMNPARKLYLDNIRWMTVVLVVIYHVVYMFNGVQPFGVIGPFREHQLQDCFQYLVYPWFMALLFVVSGMSARYYLQSHTTKQFLKDKTRKLLVPSTIGLFAFQWLLGIYNLKIGGGLNIAGLPMSIVYLITVLSGVGPLWYIQMLWLFSMLLLVVQKIEKDRVWNFCSKGLLFCDIWNVVSVCVQDINGSFLLPRRKLAQLFAQFVICHMECGWYGIPDKHICGYTQHLNDSDKGFQFRHFHSAL